MSDSSSAAAGEAAASRATAQARLRKERREAKIKAGGTARLNKITGLGGSLPVGKWFHAATPSLHVDRPPVAILKDKPARRVDTEAMDTSQVDFSSYTDPELSLTGRLPESSDIMTETQLRALMLGLEQPGGSPAEPFLAPRPSPREDDSPIVNMFAQMLAGQSTDARGAHSTKWDKSTPSPLPDRSAAVWRLAHFAVALGLGLYVVLYTSFTGSRAEREPTTSKHSAGYETNQDAFKRYFFYAFATAETVLLTTRFFIDRGRTPSTGMLWTVAVMLPPPARKFLEMGLRYAQIFTTVRSDILVCVFVLGVCSWFRRTATDS